VFGEPVIYYGWKELNMPTVKQMAGAYIEQCENKLEELRTQGVNVQKQIETLEGHIQECLNEINDNNPLDGVEASAVTKEDVT